jgi:putative membrane protein
MVRKILLRLLINAIALWAAVEIVPGIYALIRPLVAFFTCPMIILTLGLFIFIINAVMLWLTAWLAGLFNLGFGIEGGFWPAFWGALVISLVSFAISLVVKDEANERLRRRDRSY